jgi:streptogramin lyase
LLLALALAPQAQARRLLVSSYDSVLRYHAATGEFTDAFVPPGSGGLSWSHGLAFGPDGNLYVASLDTNAILRYHGQTGAFIDTFIPAGRGEMEGPVGLVFGPDGNLYVSSFSTDSILRFDRRTGSFLDVFVPTASGGLDGPTDLVFGPDGHLYVGNAIDNSVLRYDGRTGAFLNLFVRGGDGGTYGPAGIAFGPDGNLYVSSYHNHTVSRHDGKTGVLLNRFVPAGSGGLSGPTHLTFGPDGHLYVASSDNDQVLRYNGATGVFIDAFVFAGSGGLRGPTWLAFTHLEPPTDLTSSVVSRSQMDLSWTDNSEDETAFAIWRKTGSGEYTRIAVLAPNVTRYRDSGLTADTTYTYRVRATSRLDGSAWSNEASGTTFPVPPSAPSGLKVTGVASTAVSLAWTDGSRNETGFGIWRRDGNGVWARVGVSAANDPTFTDRSVSPRTRVTYRVRAHNGGGASGWTNEVTVTTP